MNKTKNTFVPFSETGLPRVGPEKDKSAEPVNWFQTLAPEMSARPAVPSVALAMPVQRNGAVPTFAAFRDMGEIEREERERRMMGLPEPPEIVEMRFQAEQTAKELVGHAYVQARAIEDEARRQGYAAGYATGTAAGRADAERVVAQHAAIDKAAWREDIAAFIAHIEAEREAAWNAMEPQITGMVFELAKHVIKQEVEVSRDVALSVVRNALRRVVEGGTLRIRVNAEDLQTVRSNREELLTLVDNIRHVEIIEDRRVGAGGCIVETDAGSIDARLETQLAEAANLLELN